MKTPNIGDYVVATKYSDGNPGDEFCVGFIKEIMADYTPPRFDVIDGNGQSFRRNGFRRVKKISKERGEFLVKNLRTIEESRFSVWHWVRAGIKDDQGT